MCLSVLPQAVTWLIIPTVDSKSKVNLKVLRFSALGSGKVARSFGFFLKGIYLFLRERGRERAWGRGRGRGERIPTRLHIVSMEPDLGLELIINHEMAT